MTRLLAVAIVLAASATAASAQVSDATAARSDPITTSVTLNGYDRPTKTFSGYVAVSASPCPGVSYGVNLPVSGVRDEADARDKASQDVSDIRAKVIAAAARCPRR